MRRTSGPAASATTRPEGVDSAALPATEASTAVATHGDSGQRAEPSTGRSTLIIAMACGFSSMAFNVWWPFLALYMIELGATSDANALFWVFVGTSIQGLSRLVTSPVWGVLSDRYGRKMMFLRALYFSCFTFLLAGIVQEPWQLAVSFAVQGIFSGFVGPAAALISVSVPESQLNSSLGRINAAQYIGTTAGPALGAALAVVFGTRETILAASLLPLVGAIAVHALVPRDNVTVRHVDKGTGKGQLEPFRWTLQFALAVFLYLVLFAVNQLVRFVIPVDLKTILHSDSVKAASGLIFSLGGAASAASILLLAPVAYKSGRVPLALGVSFLVTAVALVVMAFAGSAVLYGAGFVLMALMLSAMVPTTNALIAGNVSRARRGTAFGIASSAQAVALFIGPGGGALFAALSYDAGFAVLAALMLAIGLLLFVALKEPTAAEK
jgi:DHA1 family multidrug resistance protein-like MFS transporter